MSQFPGYTGGYAIPSMNATLEGVENQPWFGKIEQQIWLPDSVSGAARDAGNTITTLLRSGLLLGKITASGLLKEWNPVGVDGSENIYGVLGAIVHAQQNNTNQQRYVGFIMVGGNLYSDRLVVPGTAAEGIVGHALEFQILQQLTRRFLLDRHLGMQAGAGPFGSRLRYMTAAEDSAHAVTVLVGDHGKHFVNSQSDGTTVTAASAAATFTLPAAQVGLQFTFSAKAAQTINIALASGNIAQAGAVNNTTAALTLGESATFIGVAAGLYQLIANCEAVD